MCFIPPHNPGLPYIEAAILKIRSGCAGSIPTDEAPPGSGLCLVIYKIVTADLVLSAGCVLRLELLKGAPISGVVSIDNVALSHDSQRVLTALKNGCCKQHANHKEESSLHTHNLASFIEPYFISDYLLPRWLH
jgi:hypothetical protein